MSLKSAKSMIYTAVILLAIGVNVGILKYKESITIDTSVNINTEEYLPFDEDSKIYKLEGDASLNLKDNLPIVDGAAAVFPEERMKR